MCVCVCVSMSVCVCVHMHFSGGWAAPLSVFRLVCFWRRTRTPTSGPCVTHPPVPINLWIWSTPVFSHWSVCVCVCVDWRAWVSVCTAETEQSLKQASFPPCSFEMNSCPHTHTHTHTHSMSYKRFSSWGPQNVRRRLSMWDILN